VSITVSSSDRIQDLKIKIYEILYSTPMEQVGFRVYALVRF